jgi:hypothetical protein
MEAIDNWEANMLVTGFAMYYSLAFKYFEFQTNQVVRNSRPEALFGAFRYCGIK